MPEMRLVEHSSYSYGPRTWHNAKNADLTIAIAVDFTTHGEALTLKAAGDKYLALHFKTPVVYNAGYLSEWMEKHNANVLNVAGNGIYTFALHGYTRDAVFRYTYDLLELVHATRRIGKIISGGQTGVDIAGIVAARKLGIDFEATFPKGYRQRDENGKDSQHTFDEIVAQIETAQGLLP